MNYTLKSKIYAGTGNNVADSPIKTQLSSKARLIGALVYAPSATDVGSLTLKYNYGGTRVPFVDLHATFASGTGPIFIWFGADGSFSINDLSVAAANNIKGNLPRKVHHVLYDDTFGSVDLELTVVNAGTATAISLLFYIDEAESPYENDA